MLQPPYGDQMVEVINEDYADYVSLSSRLANVDGAVLRMRKPLVELRVSNRGCQPWYAGFCSMHRVRRWRKEGWVAPMLYMHLMASLLQDKLVVVQEAVKAELTALNQVGLPSPVCMYGRTWLSGGQPLTQAPIQHCHTTCGLRVTQAHHK